MSKTTLYIHIIRRIMKFRDIIPKSAMPQKLKGQNPMISIVGGYVTPSLSEGQFKSL